MPNDLLTQIERAEAQAEEIRADAAREARDMVKATESACVSAQRDAAKLARERAGMAVEQAKTFAQDEIRALELRRGAEREALREMAASRVAQTGRQILERIVGNGNL